MKTINFKTNHKGAIQKFNYQLESKINQGYVKWIVSINQFRKNSLHKSNLVVILYFTGLFLLCESCAFTWIGRSVGGDIGRPRFNDHSDPRIIKVSSEKINYGGRNHVEVHKTDSSVVTGSFRGFLSNPVESYKLSYNRYVDSLSRSVYLPHIGDSMVANNMGQSCRKITGCFEGFYRDGIRIKSGNSFCTLPMNKSLSLINSDGTEYDLETMISLFDSRQIPLQEGVIILTNINQKIIIPIGEIAFARCQKSERNGKLIGTAIGALIDAAIVVVKSRDNITDIATTMNF
jgi:hypothetical protein